MPICIFEQLDARRLSALSASINFAPSGAPLAPGYITDTGLVYGSRAGGRSFGWNVDNRANARDRNNVSSQDQRYDTLNHLQKSSGLRWEIAVPNGAYRVRVVAGDPTFSGDVMRIDAESTQVVAGTTHAGRLWLDGWARVRVTDGRLTLRAGAGSVNAKLCFVEIQEAAPTLAERLDTAVRRAADVARQTINDLANDASRYVNYTKPDGRWNVIDNTRWTSGFWPGVLWQLHRATGDASWKTSATRWTTPLANQTQKQGDLAFRFLPSYLPLYQHSKSSADRAVLLKAADAKMAMWNPTVGAFETTWFKTRTANPKANFAVLIDMTTDLELLTWAYQETGIAAYRDRAEQHMRLVTRTLVAPDGGTRHFAMFDRATGEFVGNETYQGYANNSTWARGQAWAIYSFTNMARDTHNAEFLHAACKVADFYLRNMPADGVPWWDFNDPRIPNTFRDTSAAAVVASGLLRLAKLVTDPTTAARYRAGAETILTSLASTYLRPSGSPTRGLLSEGALDIPTFPDSGNVSLIFGDYYFLEAVNQYTAR